MKYPTTLYQGITKLFLIPIAVGVLFSYAAAAAPDETAKPVASASTAPKTDSAPPPSGKQFLPEEVKKRRDWATEMHKKGTPKKGCFTSTYPNGEWKEVPCVTVPNIPFIPRHGMRPFVVGGGDDISAEAPSGAITQATGHFESPANVTSETGLIGNSGTPVNDAYSLQINTNFMTSTACAGSPNAGCRGWEQFVYFNDGTAGVAFIQYWLIQYNATCPAGWNQFQFSGGTDIYCYRNNSGGGVAVPNQPITNIANWTLTGTATATGDSVGMFDGTTLYTQAGDNSVNAAANWTEAEFNIFGAGGSSAGGGQANFNNGASVNARTQIFYGGNAAPNCLARGTTGETNNLSFGPTAPAATAPGPAVIFTESTAGGATANCAAAVTVGDTHLRTFNGLFYDFQASGDFTLAEVAPEFEVQTRQASGAPTWPNASVNKAVAARFGKTQVAICLARGTDTAARVLVDGKITAVADGNILELPEGVGLRRQGNVYQVVGEDGNSIRATVNSYNNNAWIDVSVGLGRWPSTVKGLIANVNGNVNQIATRDNFVLTNPFNFDDLYHRFADSWRVGEKKSLLSVCNTENETIEHAAPKQTFFAKDLDAGVREKALGVCTAAGVKPGALLDACTLDVAVIGQDAAAKIFIDLPPPVAVGSIVSSSSGGIQAVWQWLIWLLLLVIILIIWMQFRKKP